MIEREITRDNSGSTRGPRVSDGWPQMRTFLEMSPYCSTYSRLFPDRSQESIVDPFPMKDLTGIERHRQIEIRRGNLNGFHAKEAGHRLTLIKHG